MIFASREVRIGKNYARGTQDRVVKNIFMFSLKLIIILLKRSRMI